MYKFNVGDRVATGLFVMIGTTTISKPQTGTKVIGYDEHYQYCLYEFKLDGEPITITRSGASLRKLIIKPHYL